MTDQPSVGLFVTCLADLFRPTVGFAAAKLIEDAGCRLEVPMAQTCCGQPAYNSGDRKDARALAEQAIEAFDGFDYVVAPSGSCAAMLKKHYPGLFKGDARWEARALAFSAKVHELVSFLTDVMKVEKVESDFPAPLPITTAVRAFANSASGRSRASCFRRCPVCGLPR